MSETALFCRQVRSRSAENAAAVQALASRGLVGPAVAVLRQELDSLVRVVYLLSIENLGHRGALIGASVNGHRWRDHDGKPITDAQMVRTADRLHGWANAVYRFGCAFIHLSRFHDYLARDPFVALPAADQAVILGYLRSYHGGPLSVHPGFADLVPYFPAVFEKISSNLQCYLADLEANRSMDADDE